MVEPLATARSSALDAAEKNARWAALRTTDLIATIVRSGSPLAARVRTVRELVAAAAPAEPAAWSAAWIAAWSTAPTVASDLVSDLGADLGADPAPPALTRLFPVGLPKGELVELVGRRSAGRLGAALALLAAATSAGESAALVDLGDGFDPQEGARHGIDLTRLLWARPTHLKPALLATESLLAGGFPLVVVELGLPPVAGGRGVEAHWLRLARAARNAGALAVVSAPYRVAGFAAPLAFELSAPRTLWHGSGLEPRLLAGVDPRLALVHGRHALPDRRAAPSVAYRFAS